MPVPDTPASTDELGFDRFAVPLARTIAATDRSTTPWTIGVYGEWGSGKTTFLKLVEKALEPSGVRPIWFNAWKYARDDNLWAALIEKIVVEARRSVRWYRQPDVRLRIWLRSIDFGAGFFELFRKLLAIGFKVAMLTALILVAISLVPVNGNPVTGWFATSGLLADPAIRVLVGVLAAMGTKPEALLKLFDVKLGADLGAFRRRRLHRSQTALLDDFTAEFQGVLNVVYRRKPLVVIIDDLDRCLPEQTLQIIETIKLFLDEPGCVFLLAVDREVIEQAIRVKYKDLPAVGELGETFFEKIVQLPYSLPPPAAGRVEAYIRSISTDPEVLACLPILRGTTPYNPRRIKRSVQAFTLLKELSADLKPVASVLAKLVVIQAQYPQVYRAVVSEPPLLARLEAAYRQPELKIDTVLSAQVDRFSGLYPRLQALFSLQLSEHDTFTGVEVEAYLSIVDTVAAPEESVQEPVRRRILVMCLPEDLEWGDRVAHVLRSAGEQAFAVTPERPLKFPFHFVIGVWSWRSAGSEAVEGLWASAVAKGIPFLAVRVENAITSSFLLGKDALDTVGMADDEIDAALLERFGHGPRATAKPTIPPFHNLRAGSGTGVRRDHLLTEVRGPVVAFVGMPGSGKTTLAEQYARDHLADYRIVWVIQAATYQEDLQELARRLSVTPDRVQEQLAFAGRFLLIYDGFDDAEVILSQLPRYSSGLIIITSRNRGWGLHGPMIEVGPFSRAEAVAFLDVPDADSLAAALGDLPLALACAKGQLGEDVPAVEDYLRLLAERGTAFVRHRGLSLDAVLSEAFDRLAQINGSTVQNVLRAMSVFGPSPIPREWVRRVLAEDGEKFARAVAELEWMSLVEVVSGDFVVNPVIRRFARETPGAEVVAQAAVDLLLRLGNSSLEAGAWLDATGYAARAIALDPLNAAAAELRNDARGYTVVLLGESRRDRSELAEQLRSEFGTLPFAVIDVTDPIDYLITSTHPVDCVVAVDFGARSVVRAQAGVARAVGVRRAVIAYRPDAEAVFIEDFSDAPMVRIDPGERVSELADRLQRLVREPEPEVEATRCTQFRALLMAREGEISAARIDFGDVQRTASVLGLLSGPVKGAVDILFEVGGPVSIMVGSRFDSSIGRGVVTRIVK